MVASRKKKSPKSPEAGEVEAPVNGNGTKKTWAKKVGLRPFSDEDIDGIDASRSAGNIAADIVLLTGAVPFCDAAGHLWLRLPPIDGQKAPRPEWPIRSRKTEAFIAALLNYEGAAFGQTKMLNETILILEGYAQLNVVSEELDDVIEREPLLEMVIALCNKQESAGSPEWEGTATELLCELVKLADELGWSVETDERWPKDNAHLSQQLQGYTAALAEVGITYRRSRNRRQRSHFLTTV